MRTLFATCVLSGSLFLSACGSDEAASTSASATSAVVAKPAEDKQPELAKQGLAISTAEANYLRDAHCLDERECYGAKRFTADIIKQYPEFRDQLKRIKRTNPAVAQFDQDQLLSVVIGLYFAKQINLANSQSLYDFLTTCSTGWDENNRADFGFDEQTKQNYFSLQFFPKLRRSSNGQVVELNLVFDRRGDQVKANSIGLSHAALTNPEFLAGGGLACAS